MFTNCTIRRLLPCLIVVAATTFNPRAFGDDLPYLRAKEPYTADQKAWLAERATLYPKVEKLANTDVDGAIEDATRLLRKDRLMFGKIHRETAVGIQFLAGIYYRKGDELAFAQTTDDLIEMVATLLGENHWRVRAQNYYRNRDVIVLRMPGKIKDLLREAIALTDKGYKLWDEGKYAEALEAGSRAAGMIREVYRGAKWIPAEQTVEFALAQALQGQSHRQLGELTEAEKLLTAAEKTTRGNLGEDSLRAAQCLIVLGHLYRDRVQLELAERTYRKVLDVYEKEYEGKGRRLGLLLVELGGIYRDRRELARAEEVVRRGVELIAADVGKVSESYALALTRMAVLVRMTGKTKEAEELLREAVAIAVKLTGGKGLRYAYHLHHLANQLCKDPKTAAEAIKLTDEVVPLYREAGLEKKIDFANLLSTRGAAQRRAEDFVAAEVSLKQALDVVRGLSGQSKESVRRFVNGLIDLYFYWGQALARDGKREEAREAGRKRVNLLAEEYGPTHYQTTDGRLWLVSLEKAAAFTPEQRERDTTVELFERGIALRNDEKFEEAIVILEKALRLREELYGPDDMLIAQYAIDLGATYRQFGRRTDCERQYQRSIDLYRRLWGEDNMPPVHADLLYAYGFLLQDRGDHAKALPLFQTARRVSRTNYGDAGPINVEATDAAAFALIELGEFDQAETLLKENMAIQERSGGTKTVAYARTLRYLGRLRMRTNDRKEGWKLVLEAEKTLAELAKGTKLVSPHQVLLQVELAEYDCEEGLYADALPHLTWTIDAFAKSPVNVQAMGLYYTHCLRWLGVAYTETFDYDKGEKYFRDAIIELRKRFGPDPALYRTELTLLGQVMNYKSAKAYREGKLDVYLTERKRIVDAYAEFVGADHWQTQGARADLTTAERIVKLDAAARKRWEENRAAANRVVALIDQRKASEALALADQVLTTTRELLGVDNAFYPDDLEHRALALSRAGRRADAARAWTEVIDAASKTFGAECGMVGSAKIEQGRLELANNRRREAIERFDEAANLLTQAYGARTIQTGIALTWKGEAALGGGDLLLAEKSLRAAHAALSPWQRSAAADYNWCLGLYATSILRLRDFDRAGKLALRHQELAERVFGKESRQFAVAAYDLGDYYVAINDVKQAESSYREASKIHLKTSGDNSRAYADSLLAIANCCRTRGDSVVAQPLYKQALAIYQKVSGVESSFVAGVMLERGRMHLEAGDLKQGEEDVRGAAEIWKKQLGEASGAYGSCLPYLGDLAFQRGDRKAAEEFYQTSLSRRERNAARFAGAQTEDQQFALAASLRESLDHYLSLSAISPVDAYAHVLAWKGAILSRQQRLRTLRSDPKNADAFKEWERLTGELSTLALRPPYPEDRDVWVGRFRDLTAKRAQTEAGLATALARIESPPLATPTQVAAAIPADAALIDLLEYNRRVPARDKPGHWEEQRHLVAFVLRPGKPVERFELGPIDPIVKLVEAWLKETVGQDSIDYGEFKQSIKPGDSEAEQAKKMSLVQNKNTPAHLARLESHGRPLRAAIWDPLESSLALTKTVLISPDGVLCRFPIAALPGKKVGSFLIEDRTLTLLPIPALLTAARPPLNAGGLHGIGGVNYGGSPGPRDNPANRGGPFQFGPLDGTLAEIDRIQEIFEKRFPGERVAVSRGADAKESMFRREAPKARWIHLATHGYYVTNVKERAFGQIPKSVPTGSPLTLAATPAGIAFHSGLLSGVAFAGANTPNSAREDDGLLSSLEVASMDLSGVELAGLSACQTGLGMTTSGEGVLGLQRAFQAAGVRSVMATLWSVDDRGTYLLMSRFYENLWDRKTTKAAALHEAQLWLIESGRKATSSDAGSPPAGRNGYFQRPNTWAAVVLSGDPR